MQAPNPQQAGNHQPLIDSLLPPIAGNRRLVFVNGHLVETPVNANSSEILVLDSLAHWLDSHASLIEDHLGKALPQEPHGFTCANSASFQDGALIVVAENLQVDSPIELVFISASDNPTVAHPRNLIICEPNSSAIVVERHIGTIGSPCLNNPITEIFTHHGARLDHYKIQDEQDKGFHIGGIFISQDGDSNVSSNNIGLGGLLARTDIFCSLGAPGAHVEMNGLVVGNGRRHIDNCTEVVHAAPHCSSDEYYKSILDDRSRSVFRGRIIVAQDAQKTSADQQSKSLLLSELSEADVKPQLEIYADDVKCSHGATVGQLDSNSVFYLRSRGIDEATARSLLTFAFANDVIERMSLPGVRSELTTLLAGRLLSENDAVGLS